VTIKIENKNSWLTAAVVVVGWCMASWLGVKPDIGGLLSTVQKYLKNIFFDPL
jgi:hypothetical protein